MYVSVYVDRVRGNNSFVRFGSIEEIPEYTVTY